MVTPHTMKHYILEDCFNKNNLLDLHLRYKSNSFLINKQIFFFSIGKCQIHDKSYIPETWYIWWIFYMICPKLKKMWNQANKNGLFIKTYFKL